MQLQINIENKSHVELKLESLEEVVSKVKTSSDNVRKGMFSRHADLARMYLEIKGICEKQSLIIDDLKRIVEGKYGSQAIQNERGALYSVSIDERSEDGFIGSLKERCGSNEYSDEKCVSICV